jgi:putative acetyltransferase
VNASRQTLRAFEPADVEVVADLWVAAWKTTGLPIDFAARRAWLVARLAQLAKEGAAILVGLNREGRPAGLVTVDPKSGAVDQLCVAPSERGGDLARALIDEAKRRSPGVVDLDVNVANPRARRFYEREGFVGVGVGASALSGLLTLRLRWRRGGRRGGGGPKEKTGAATESHRPHEYDCAIRGAPL